MPPKYLPSAIQSVVGGGTQALAYPQKIGTGAPSTLGQLYGGAPTQPQQGPLGGAQTPQPDLGLGGGGQQPKKKFWDKAGGKALGSVLSVLGLGLLGAGLGAITGGGRGARQGAVMGSTLGILTDLGQRRAGAAAPLHEKALRGQQALTPYQQIRAGLSKERLDLSKKRLTATQQQRKITLTERKKRFADKMKEASDSIAAVGLNMDELEKTLMKIPSGRVKGRGAQIKGFLVGDPDIKEYNTIKGLTLSNISRNLGGERGVLTDRDIDRIEKGFPQISDTPEERRRSIERIRRTIETRMRQYRTRSKEFKGETKNRESIEDIDAAIEAMTGGGDTLNG